MAKIKITELPVAEALDLDDSLLINTNNGTKLLPASKVGSGGPVIDDLDDIEANTEPGMVAGALALKALNAKIGQGGGGGFFELPLTVTADAMLVGGKAKIYQVADDGTESPKSIEKPINSTTVSTISGKEWKAGTLGKFIVKYGIIAPNFDEYNVPFEIADFTTSKTINLGTAPRALIPTITSDNSSVFSSSNSGTNYQTYRAFDGNSATHWGARQYQTGDIYVGYIFDSPTIARRVMYQSVADGTGGITATIQLVFEGSNNTTDGTDGTWTPLHTETYQALPADATREVPYTINNSGNPYKAYRVRQIGYLYSGYNWCATFQLYDR